MLKIEKKNGTWQARIVGKPSKDVVAALRSLSTALDGARAALDDVIEGDPCGGRACAGCESTVGCDPEEASVDYAMDSEIAYASCRGMTFQDVEHWDQTVEEIAEMEAATASALAEAHGDEGQA